MASSSSFSWVAVGVAVLAVACSSSTNGSGDTNGGDDAGVVDASHDAATDGDGAAADVMPPTTCMPAGVHTFQPPTYRPATGEYQNKCTLMQISDFYEACLSPTSTTTTCARFSDANMVTPADKQCASCIYSHEVDAKWGPVVSH